jgi:signal transduction histidine kinase
MARRGYRPLEGADRIFALLRVGAFVCIVGWYYFTPQSPDLTNLLVVFTGYSVLFYLAFFFVAVPVAVLYLVVHILDLLFITLLVAKTGGMESNFFVGFYILAALNGLYFGWRSGLFMALVTSGLYYLTDPAPLAAIHWTDFLLRCAPLFLLALTMGFLSEQIDRDRRRIELLNTTLQETLSHLKEAQLQLLEQERLSALGQVAADIAHEIRNPLVAIGGFARRLVERATGDPSSARYSRIIMDETARLERILDDVLLYTRQKNLNLKPLDLNALAEEVISLSEPLLTARNISIERNYDPSLPPVSADRDQLHQVLVNITLNAEQAMGEGGRLTVKTFSDVEDGRPWVCVSITDTGPGIEPALKERIFDPFFSTKPIGEGTGLGLSICKKIVEDHGGSIHVDSTPGQGATFTVRLPPLEPAEKKEPTIDLGEPSRPVQTPSP